MGFALLDFADSSDTLSLLPSYLEDTSARLSRSQIGRRSHVVSAPPRLCLALARQPGLSDQ